MTFLGNPIDDATVQIYLDEIKAPPAVRERWATLRARGVPWQETYVKHARIEIDGEQAATAPAAVCANKAVTLTVGVLGTAS